MLLRLDAVRAVRCAEMTTQGIAAEIEIERTPEALLGYHVAQRHRAVVRVRIVEALQVGNRNVGLDSMGARLRIGETHFERGAVAERGLVPVRARKRAAVDGFFETEP